MTGKKQSAFPCVSRLIHLISILVSTVAVWAAESGGPPATLDELCQRLAAHIDRPKFEGATWGIEVVSLKTGERWFSRNADLRMIPASNAKLFTAALALDRLGPDFRFETLLHASRLPTERGTLFSDLVIEGRGDPTFASRFHDGDHRKSLSRVVAAIRKAGIKRIRGDLVGDAGYFRGPQYGLGWDWDDLQYYYAAPVSALSVDDNTVDLVFHAGPSENAPVRIVTRPETGVLEFVNRAITQPAGFESTIRLVRRPGSARVHVAGQVAEGGEPVNAAVTVPEPVGFFLEQLERALKRKKISVSGKRIALDPLTGAAPREGLKEVGRIRSEPLPGLLQVMMKRSNNLYAQMLFLQVGARAEDGSIPIREEESDSPPATTEEAARRALHAFLEEMGIDPGAVLLDEGSGLSRGCLITPAATVQLLRTMHHHRDGAVFRDSLPLAGREGTLANRMKGTAAEGNVRAKTGTLRRVHALSGYLSTASGEPLAFSILLNHHADLEGRDRARNEVDRLATLLAAFPAPRY